jgi:hypothetical protein
MTGYRTGHSSQFAGAIYLRSRRLFFAMTKLASSKELDLFFGGSQTPGMAQKNPSGSHFKV